MRPLHSMKALARAVAAVTVGPYALAAGASSLPQRAMAQGAALAAPVDSTLRATAGFPSDRFIPADTPVAFSLTRPLAPSEGRLALVIDGTDVSALAEPRPPLRLAVVAPVPQPAVPRAKSAVALSKAARPNAR